MSWYHTDGLEYVCFESFPKDKVKQGIFSRLGGVSPAPWDGLNLGGTVGDSRENVIENRRRMFASLERPVESLFDVWQVHSRDVVCSENPRPLDQAHQKADAILTANSHVTLLMRFADCVPILLYDPDKKVVGLVHAGWMGTVSQIVLAAVNEMQRHYGSLPRNILAGIGPSIGPDHYEIGPDVVEKVHESFLGQAKDVLAERDGRSYLDLWKSNRLLLESAGVRSIEVAGVCTACDIGHWYSHRAEHGKTGRFGALIGLA